MPSKMLVSMPGPRVMAMGAPWLTTGWPGLRPAVSS
ncbi:Uncharacterised protein [Flavonifractor plautii]|jgi:hypothetical protein|uniref:Uncharacterized protein n=1 Tax=Flavonifractor plautii TaxID=292800 RepID=A0A174T6L9_FLAPL|nr:Uncharacterised protein [Flavonifractor plautii]